MTNETRGRKKLINDQKKIPVTIYLPQIQVLKFGGKESLKTKLLNYVTNNSERLQQN